MNAIDCFFLISSGIFIALSYVVKKKALYILFQTISNVILAANYLYVQSLSSAISVVIGTIRFIVYYVLVAKYDDIPWWVIIAFTLTVGVFGVCTAKQPIDYLFVSSVMLYSMGYKIRDLMRMKVVLMLPLAMMFTYALIVNAYSGIIGQGFELVVISTQAIAFAISNKKKKSAKSNEQIDELPSAA